MAKKCFTFFLIIILIQYVNSYNLKYSIKSNTIDGKECMTDCDEAGLCWISYNQQGHCIHGYEKAPTYLTARYRYASYSECHSKCVFDGKSYSWCYIDDDGYWDYCSAETTAAGKWFEYTHEYGRCKNACGKYGEYYLWCNTLWSKPYWDYCDEGVYHYEETASTIYGLRCLDNCELHVNSYWCIDENELKSTCAPSAVPHACQRPKQRHERSLYVDDISSNDNYGKKNLTRVRRSQPPRRTVAEYNQDIDDLVQNDPDVHTNILSTPNRPVMDNPTLDYTYRDYNGLQLPLRVRAIIRPYHINKKKRDKSAVSDTARDNCRAMGLNRCLPNNNNDECGHMVPYILSGSNQWYNIVPQTRRLNTGTTGEATDLIYPSVWAVTERSMRTIVSRGGYVEFTVAIAYDLPCTRPTGFGVTERYYNSNGVLDFECLGFWHSNDPFGDPDEWNFG